MVRKSWSQFCDPLDKNVTCPQSTLRFLRAEFRKTRMIEIPEYNWTEFFSVADWSPNTIEQNFCLSESRVQNNSHSRVRNTIEQKFCLCPRTEFRISHIVESGNSWTEFLSVPESRVQNNWHIRVRNIIEQKFCLCPRAEFRITRLIESGIQLNFCACPPSGHEPDPAGHGGAGDQRAHLRG